MAPWLTVGDRFVLNVGILIDNLTAVMLLVVTGVSTLVHLFSIGYMHGDPRYSRFFAYLSIFSFSMLGLVLAESFFFIYIFWELVGLSSYLLIGFWFEKKSAADAGKKAFIVNRIGRLRVPHRDPDHLRHLRRAAGTTRSSRRSAKGSSRGRS